MAELSEAQRLYDRTRDDLLRRHSLNCDNLDRAILGLSSAGLGLGLTAAEKVECACCGIPLVLSWVCLLAAIFATLASFFCSQRAIYWQLNAAERYYLREEKNALAERNPYDSGTTLLMYLSTGSFCLGVVFLTVALGSQIASGRKGMENDQQPKRVQGGQGIVPMQPVDEQRGQTLVPMQPVVPPPDGNKQPQTDKPKPAGDSGSQSQ